MSEKATEWFGMRVAPTQKQKIKRLAEQKGTTQKAAVLDAVERELAENGAEGESPSASELIEDLVGVEAKEGSVLAQTEDLCGSVEGPEDLSTNPRHMEDYGKD